MRQARALWFVMPDPDGFVSGGNRYNAELLRALRGSGRICEALSPAQAETRFRSTAPDYCVVDTLHLDAVPTLVARAAERCPVLLLVHYLPSLLGRPLPEEHAALSRSDGACATSAFMKRELVARGMPESRVFVVEPGRTVAAASELRAGAGCSAVLVANLVENKGVLPLLAALALELRPDDTFSSTIIGSPLLEPSYAARCHALVLENAVLRDRITFTGALDHEQVLERLRRADLFVSASRMEAYGMALAEARAAGLPILAVSGGNVDAHVDALAGGASCASPAALAAACVALCRAPEELGRRRELARRTAPPARPWSRVGEGFMAGCQTLSRA